MQDRLRDDDDDDDDDADYDILYIHDYRRFCIWCNFFVVEFLN
jgi:hypothetical protein